MNHGRRLREAVAGLLLTMVLVSAANAQEKGLLGWWKFDEGKGDLAADSSGNGYDGEVVNAEWVKGPFGVALRFIGENSCVSMPEIAGLDKSDELTVETWVFWEGSGRYPNILTAGQWSPGGFMMFVSDSHCSFRMGKPGVAASRMDGGWKETSASFLTPFALGRWYHLAATFRRPLLQTYVNGERVSSADWDFPIGYSGEFVVGKWGGTASHNGLIDEVKVYNKALAADEVKAEYAKESAKRSGSSAAGGRPYEKILAAAEAEPPAVTLQNDFVKLMLNDRLRAIGLIDNKTGKNYLASSTTLATLKRNSRYYKPTACSYKDGRLTIVFGRSGVTAVLGVRAEKRYFVFEVVSLTPEDVEELTFLNFQVAPSKYVDGMSGVAADDEFATCLRCLNLQAQPTIGGAQRAILRATCNSKYGLIGAKAALVACPVAELRPALKDLVRKEGSPYSPLGGPFALDAPMDQCSYLFASGLSEKNVDEWIGLARMAGTPIIHLCDWNETLGHYEPRKGYFPHGLAGLKAVVQRIHDAGMWAGMHTLTGCISPNDPFVRPVPDKRLAKDAAFTLAGPVDEQQKEVRVLENPRGLDTVFTYGSRGNIIQIDDELIQYNGLSEEPPYAFTKCTRGVFGTKVAAHQSGAAAHHLRHRYGFLPDENSTLVGEVADCIAKVANECGFDLIYMDGAEGMPDGAYGAAKMRTAIFERIKRPIRVESSWGGLHHCWPFHSCVGAWDYPNWGLKQFTELHCVSIEKQRQSSLMPVQLGWWVILPPGADHDGEFPDEMEHLCGKALGYDASMSFEVVSLQPQNARQNEYLRMVGRYEKLRLSGYFSDSVKAQLREPRAEFCLSQAPDGEWQLTPTDYLWHKATVPDDPTASWTITNRFPPGPAGLRIQALYSAGPYDGPEGVLLSDFSGQDEFKAAGAPPGVTCSLTASTDQVKAGQRSGCLIAKNSKSERRGAWAGLSKTFTPPLDLRSCGAMGVWVYGDGKGEVLNFQLGDPPIYHGSATRDEHYVIVDFTGWRYFELLLRERDAERHSDYVWPYNGISAIYRSPLVRSQVSTLNIYCNNLPPGDAVKCYISPIKALPAGKRTLANPALAVGGRRITFPVTMESGQYIEFNSMTECTLRDERGAVLGEVSPKGDVPRVERGENACVFSCDPPPGKTCRARVTVICSGEPLRGMAPGKEELKQKFRNLERYQLARRPDGGLRFPRCDEKAVCRLDGKENVWTIENQGRTDEEISELAIHVGQEIPGKAYDEALPLEDFEDVVSYTDQSQYSKYVVGPKKKGLAKEGVTASLVAGPGSAKSGRSYALLQAAGTLTDSSGWAAAVKGFSPPLDLSFMKGMGLWVKGDGKGASLKVQMQDAQGQRQDHYISLDFSDWRYFELVHPAMGEINKAQVVRLLFYLVGIPAKGSVACGIDGVNALRECPKREVVNPRVTLGDALLSFPVTLRSGDALVFRGKADATLRSSASLRSTSCQVFDAQGNTTRVEALHELPRLKPGESSARFECEGTLANEVKIDIVRE